jgi:spore coat polysaccharide biosynthesis protein SpsF
MKIIAVIPARLNSSRLPKKVLFKINNLTLLEIIYKKLSKLFREENIYVATSINKSDDELFKLCKEKKMNIYRGPLNNVSSRIYKLAKLKKANGILRINGDSPLINLIEIKKSIRLFKTKKFDLVTNIFPRSFPIGMSIEVIKTEVLEKVVKEIKKKSHKEHVTKYFYDNYKKFKILNVKNKINYSKIHLAVDTKTDFLKVKKIYLYLKNKRFNLKKIVKEYEKN